MGGPPAPTIQAKALLRAVPVLAEHGIAIEAYLARLGVKPGQFGDPEFRVPFDLLVRAWELVEELTGDPHVAVRTVLATERSHYGLLGHLVANSPDFGTGLERVIRYQPIWGDGSRLEQLQTEGTVEVRHIYVDAKHAASRHLNVLVLPTFVRLARELAEGDFPVDAAGFYHSEPPGAEIYAKLYPCPIEFDAPCNYLRFPSRNLSVPLKGSDAYFSRHLVEIADSALRSAKKDDGFHAQVRSAIIEAVRRSDTSVQSVSRQLAMSVRTLQRRLRENGTTFQELLEAVRAELATEYLKRSELTADEVGFMLGYAERSAFHRAFRRWTGVTPVQYARAHR